MKTIKIDLQEVMENLKECLAVETGGIYFVQNSDDLAGLLAEDLSIQRASICGSGPMSLKVAEALQDRGIHVSILQAENQVLPEIIDRDFSPYVERHLRATGRNIVLNQVPTSIEIDREEGKLRSIQYSGLNQPTDLLLITKSKTTLEQPPCIDIGAGLQVGVARRAGSDTNAVSVFIVLNDQPLSPENPNLILKLVADTETRQLLRVQALGENLHQTILEETDRALDNQSTVDDLAQGNPDRALTQACQVLRAKLDGEYISVQPEEYLSGKASGYTVLDCCRQPEIFGATVIDMEDPGQAEELQPLAKDKPYLLVCSRGRRANRLQQSMRAQGFTNTHVLEGGLALNQVIAPRTGTKLTPAQIKAVKALGCLQDKRYEDVFNVRVITRNGKITAAEQAAIAEAAEHFGSGEITMTSRLTLEIQGVRYDKIPELRDFLASHGLETGGTGSKVRPVVSCKGTTCQFGLIDTFSLSEKIHDRFYKGFGDVTLPHKFKIAVGGCPNNCVKPDLNDIGILGQRVPRCNLNKCRSCNVCNVEKTCPIKVAHTDEDGKVYIDMEACNHCGLCIKRCPFGAVEEVLTGYKIFIGGRWGKKGSRATPLEPLFTTEEEVLNCIERIILFYRDAGITGERFADTIDRLGFDAVSDKILYGDISKDDILVKSVVGGAAC